MAYCLYALFRSTVFDKIVAPFPRDQPSCNAPSSNVPSLSLTHALPECQRNSAKVIVHQATCFNVLRSIFSWTANALFVAFSEKSSITRSFPDCWIPKRLTGTQSQENPCSTSAQENKPTNQPFSLASSTVASQVSLQGSPFSILPQKVCFNALPKPSSWQTPT